MVRCAFSALLALVALVPAPSLLAAPSSVETRISAVTIYADRAQVTRTGTVVLKETPTTWVIDALPGWIDPESVRASSSSGDILDVRVEKSFLIAPSDGAVRKADAAVQAVQDRLDDLQDEMFVLEAEVVQLENVRAFSLDKLPQDMVARDVKIERFSETVAFVTGALRKNRVALRKVMRQRRDLQPELQAAARARDELRARSQLEQAKVLVELRGRGKATLTLTYLTSGASWEPSSELRVGKKGKHVSIVQSALVVQSTGEDWTDARLTFSTQLPGETLVVPEVQALLLGTNGAGLRTVVRRAGASFEKARAAYVSQSSIANIANPNWKEQVMRQSAMQARAKSAFQKLAKRGTTAHFDALASRTVRADGKIVRVPFSSSRLAAVVKLVAVPEVSLNVIRTAQLVNTSEQSILPGRSTLYVDGAFVGVSELPFVAQGEEFSVFLGVHTGVKLTRVIDRKRSEIDRGWRRTTVTASFLITAENLDGTPVTLELGDRVPVPQDDVVDVDDIELPRGATQDRDGVVKWTAVIAPGEKATWRLEYELEYPNDFLTKVSRPAPAQAPRRMLYDQIDALESTL